MIRLALSKIVVCLIRTYMCHAGKVLSYTKLSLTLTPLNAKDAIVAHTTYNYRLRKIDSKDLETRGDSLKGDTWRRSNVCCSTLTPRQSAIRPSTSFSGERVGNGEGGREGGSERGREGERGRYRVTQAQAS